MEATEFQTRVLTGRDAECNPVRIETSEIKQGVYAVEVYVATACEYRHNFNKAQAANETFNRLVRRYIPGYGA